MPGTALRGAVSGVRAGRGHGPGQEHEREHGRLPTGFRNCSPNTVNWMIRASSASGVKMPTAATVHEIALALPDVQTKPCYGTQAYYVRRRLFARMLEDDDLVVIKADPDRREVLTSAQPEKFFVTDHYRNHPMMIVRLSSVDRSELQELLQEAREYALG